MNERLLRAVLEEPDDDAPRLAYAAWCSAQTEPAEKARGEFIRTQIRLAALGEDGPLELRNDLGYEEQKLRRAYARVWAGELASLTDEYFFHRGFAAMAVLPARRFLEAGPRLFSLAPIRHLNMTDAAAAAAELFASPLLLPIRSMGLDDCGLRDSDMRALTESSRLPALRWLSLANNRLSLEGAEILAASALGKRLIYANLHGNPVDPGELYSLDDGRVVGAWLPEEGLGLERRHGRLAWLHSSGDTIWNLVPDRFRLRERDASPRA